jgi:hypothetical protein
MAWHGVELSMGVAAGRMEEDWQEIQAWLSHLENIRILLE